MGALARTLRRKVKNFLPSAIFTADSSLRVRYPRTYCRWAGWVRTIVSPDGHSLAIFCDRSRKEREKNKKAPRARGARHEPARFPKAKADGSRSRRASRGAREMATDLLGAASLSPDPSIPFIIWPRRLVWSAHSWRPSINSLEPTVCLPQLPSGVAPSIPDPVPLPSGNGARRPGPWGAASFPPCQPWRGVVAASLRTNQLLCEQFG